MASYLLTSTESEVGVVGPFPAVEAMPGPGLCCLPSAVCSEWTLLFSALRTVTSRALPLIDKLEEINECWTQRPWLAMLTEGTMPEWL